MVLLFRDRRGAERKRKQLRGRSYRIFVHHTRGGVICASGKNNRGITLRNRQFPVTARRDSTWGPAQQESTPPMGGGGGGGSGGRGVWEKEGEWGGRGGGCGGGGEGRKGVRCKEGGVGVSRGGCVGGGDGRGKGGGEGGREEEGGGGGGRVGGWTSFKLLSSRFAVANEGGVQRKAPRGE